VVFTEKKLTKFYKIAFRKKYKLAFWIRQTCAATPQLILRFCWSTEWEDTELYRAILVAVYWEMCPWRANGKCHKDLACTVTHYLAVRLFEGKSSPYIRNYTTHWQKPNLHSAGTFFSCGQMHIDFRSFLFSFFR